MRREGFGFALFHLAFVFWFAFGSISFLAFFSATLTHVVCLSLVSVCLSISSSLLVRKGFDATSV